MATRDYAELINLATELGHYDGYLDTAGIAERDKAKAGYQKALRVFVYHLLKEGHSAEMAKRLVEADLHQIAGHSNAHWLPVYDEVRADLLAQIARDGGKKGWQRALRYYAPAIVGAILAAIYFGVRLYSALPVDKPLDSREGLIQRAAVIEKMARYDDWTSGRSGGRGEAIRDLLLWPIEPNGDEVKAGDQLIALIGSRYLILTQAKQACVLVVAPDSGLPGDQRVEMFRKVAAYLRGPGAVWAQPLANTVDTPIKTAYPCSEIDYQQIQETVQDELYNRQVQPALPPSH